MGLAPRLGLVSALVLIGTVLVVRFGSAILRASCVLS